MEKSCTILKKHQITHEWVIKDFTNYIDLYNDEKEHTLYSSQFTPIKNDSIRFRLVLTFNQNFAKKDSLAFFLHCDDSKLFLKLQCHFYLLNNQQKKDNEYKLITTIDGRDVQWGYSTFCAKSYLLNHIESLLPNNTLTLGCDLTVYEDGITKVITYEYKPQCPIVCQFKELLENQTFSDFTFEVDNQEFKAHKIILITRCPVFNAMFGSEMIETKNNRVNIKDISPKIFKMMLEFIYTDQVEANLTKDNAIKLFVAADKYQLEDLKGICEKNIHDLLNIENAVEILFFAEQYKMEQLITNAKTLIEIYPAQILTTVMPLLKNHNN